MGSKKFNWKNFFKYTSLIIFIIASLVILIESAVPGEESAEQSNGIADIIQNNIDANHDKDTIKELKSFDLEFNEEIKESYYVNDEIYYKINYEPADTSYKTLDWEINNPSLIKIDHNNSSIKFLKEGEVKIKISSTYNKEIFKEYIFNINKVNVKDIKINVNSLTLNKGDNYLLLVEFIPNNSTNQKLHYLEYDKNIIQVNDKGLINAINPGKTHIKVVSDDNNNIYKIIDINVKEDILIEPTDIKIDNQILYSYEEKEIRGYYNPLNSDFNLNELKINIENNNNKLLEISNLKLNINESYFSFIIHSLTEIKEEKIININIKYKDLIDINFKINLLPLKTLNINDIDINNTNKSYISSIYENNYYHEYNSSIINLKINYLDNILSSLNEYNLYSYYLEHSSKIKIESSTFNEIKISATNKDSFKETIKYYPNKEDKLNYLAIDIIYNKETSNEKITDIILDSFDTSITYKLKNNYLYDDIFKYQIISNNSLDNNNNNTNTNSFNNSGINVELLNKEYGEIIYKNNRPYALKLNELIGSTKLKITSTYEDNIKFNNKLVRYINIVIEEKPTSSALFINGKEYLDFSEEYQLGLRDKIKVELKSYYDIKLKNKEFKIELNLPYDVLISNSNSFKYVPLTSSIEGLNNGKDLIKFKFKDDSLSSLDKELKIYINYIPIDINIFNFDFELIECPLNNEPNINYDVISINTKIKINPIINEDASNKEINLLSSDTSILEILDNNVIYAKKEGKVNLIMSSKFDNNIKINKEINVIHPNSPFNLDLESIDPIKSSIIYEENNKDKIKYYELDLDYGKGYQIKIFKEEYATSTNLVFDYLTLDNTQSNKDIIEISENGYISTLNIGETWLKISYGDALSPNTQNIFVKINVYRNTLFTFNELAMLVRKGLGHFGLFLCTAFSGMLYIILEFKTYKGKVIATSIYSLLGIILAALSEGIQYITPGRYFTLKDIIIDSLGYLSCTIIFIIIFLILWLIKYIKDKQNNKNKDNN